MELSGKVVFKIKLGKEIKKSIIHNEDITYNELLLMIQRIFSEKIKPNDEFSIKYTDDENDLITLENDSDVSIAIKTCSIIKLTIFLKKDQEEIVEHIRPNEIVKELQKIRSSIDSFLEKLEYSIKAEVKNNQVEDLTKNVNEIKFANVNGNSNVLNNDFHKEFDPLSQKNELNDSLKTQQKVSRAQTPDSINSLELSSNQKFSNQNNDPNYLQQQFQTQNNNINSFSNFNNVDNKQTSNLPPQNLSKELQSSYNQLQQPQFHSAIQNQPTATQPSQISNQFYQNNLQNSKPQQQPNQQLPTQSSNFISQHYAQIPPSLSNPGIQSVQSHTDPAQQQKMFPQQYYQQQGVNLNAQHQQQHQTHQIPSQLLQQQNTHPNMINQQGFTNNLSNPYAKPPSTTLARPPSATALYQQGYK